MARHKSQLTVLLAFFLLAGGAYAALYVQEKGKDKDKKEEKKPEGKKDEPLLTKKLGIRSSRQSEDTATLGYKGVGPDGQVEKAALDAGVAGDATQLAAAMAAYTLPAGEVEAFAKEGNLNATAVPKKAASRRRPSAKRQASADSRRRKEAS
jgi:hypothetical protein